MLQGIIDNVACLAGSTVPVRNCVRIGMRDWAPAYAERRKLQRVRANKRVIVIHRDGLRRGCSVHDVSPRGARLELGTSYPLPTRFELLFTNGRRVKAHLVWQNGPMAGVFFDTPLNFFERFLCELSISPFGSSTPA